jgi:hypothetical protein
LRDGDIILLFQRSLKDYFNGLLDSRLRESPLGRLDLLSASACHAGRLGDGLRFGRRCERIEESL